MGTEIDGKSLVSLREDTVGLARYATTPLTYNITMILADTEYPQILPANTTKFFIKTRDDSSFRIAWETGKVATSTEPYTTVPAKSPYWEDHLKLLTALTIYFASALAGRVIEIGVWT